MKKSLGKKLTDWVYGHLRQANVLATQGDPAGSDALVRLAWELVPEPRLEWDCSGRIIEFITKYFRDAHQVDKALRWADFFIYENTLDRNGGPALLKGSMYFRSGKRPFQNENLNYWTFITSRLKPPASGTW